MCRKSTINDEDNIDAVRARRRLNGFSRHLVAYFLAMIVLLLINYYLAQDTVWSTLPMVGWGSVLAIHAAYVMGLLKGITRNHPPS